VLEGRYGLIRQIAVGGMGEVWEATDTLLGRRVAVKILKEEFRTAPTFLARFRAEARHAGQLNHPGIATVYDYGETGELAFLVMELVQGRALSEVIGDGADLSDIAKLEILAQAAEALQAAHEAGVVHRDVKPGNLMVRPDGTVKVTDFGIARALTSAPLTEHGQMVGTPAYVSPEQASGGEVTGSSDIYSLGVVAYEMFAGHAPFRRDTPLAIALAHVNDPPSPLPDTVPAGIAGLIRSALAKDPAQRPPSAAAFADQLRRETGALRGAPAAPPPPIPPGQETSLAPTTGLPASNGPRRAAPSTLVAPAPGARDSTRSSSVAVVAFACLLVILGVTIWAATRSSPVGDDPPTEPAAGTDAPAVETEPPTTEPPATEPPSTEPQPTEPQPTEPPVEPPPAPEPPAGLTPAPAAAGTPVAASEAIGFVVAYYDLIADGDYATTWESLSPEFRASRNLTFERYVSYWQDTSIEVRDLRFLPGPGNNQGRVRFDARYDLGTRVVEETDEITLRRQPDGRLIITAQRTV
jgi:eukaryotic-like serine/threonine-protein kinase